MKTFRDIRLSISRCYGNYAELSEFGANSKFCDRSISDKDGVTARIFDSNQKLKKLYADSEKLNTLKEYDDDFFVNNSILIIIGLIGGGNFAPLRAINSDKERNNDNEHKIFRTKGGCKRVILYSYRNG